MTDTPTTARQPNDASKAVLGLMSGWWSSSISVSLGRVPRRPPAGRPSTVETDAEDAREQHPAAEPIRVLVVDDHPAVRAGVALVLDGEPGIEVVGQAGDGAEAVRRAADVKPDVVLMDLKMPNVDGVDGTRQLLRDHPDVKVVILTSLADRSRILQALQAGAVGFMLKDIEPDGLIDGVRAAHRKPRPGR